MEVGVRITGHAAIPGTETTFTQNVSPRGARVLSTRRLEDQRSDGDFDSDRFVQVRRRAWPIAQLTPESNFAVGLEFIEPNGKWVVASRRLEHCATTVAARRFKPRRLLDESHVRLWHRTFRQRSELRLVARDVFLQRAHQPLGVGGTRRSGWPPACPAARSGTR